jgi:hypothetical protein
MAQLDEAAAVHEEIFHLTHEQSTRGRETQITVQQTYALMRQMRDSSSRHQSMDEEMFAFIKQRFQQIEARFAAMAMGQQSISGSASPSASASASSFSSAPVLPRYKSTFTHTSEHKPVVAVQL